MKLGKPMLNKLEEQLDAYEHIRFLEFTLRSRPSQETRLKIEREINKAINEYENKYKVFYRYNNFYTNYK